jgi:diguanylate cyclase (GGDEF)-like protein
MPKFIILYENQHFNLALKKFFVSQQTELIIAADDKTLIRQSETEKPDLIILDAELSEERGFTLYKSLKKKRKTRHIPVMLLKGAKKDTDIDEKYMATGVDEFYVVPSDVSDLANRAQTIIKRSQLYAKFETETGSTVAIRNTLSQKILELQQVNKALEETAEYDRLTGLYNKTYFLKRLKETFHHALRYDKPLSLAIIDLDAFGRVNDRLGFDIGDYVLVKVSNLLLIHSKAADIVGRLEGANFGIILPDANMQRGIFEAERLRTAINQTDYIGEEMPDIKEAGRIKKKSLRFITASIGVATNPSEISIKNDEALFQWAVKALNQAKKTGKNKTIALNEISSL